MPAAPILEYAAWFGFVTGVVEGLLLYLLRSRELLRGQISFLGASSDVVWIAPLFDVLLYLLVGVLLAVLARFIPEKSARRLVFLTFCFLLSFAWISTYLEGRISAVATIILAAGIAYQLSAVLREREQRFSPFVRKTLKAFILAWIALVVVIQGGYWLQERISTNKLRPDHLLTQGHARLTDPTRKPLASEGVTSDNSYTAASWTGASRASLFTGRWPHQRGADAGLPLEESDQSFSNMAVSGEY